MLLPTSTKIAAGLSLMAIFLCRLWGQGVEADGELSFIGYRPDGNVLAQGKIDFTVILTTNRWYIRTSDARGSAPGEPPTTMEMATDGVDIYSILHTPASRIQKSPGVPLYGETGKVRQGQFPADQSIYEKLIWIAYGSGKYFREATNELMDSVFAFSPTNRVRFRLQTTSEVPFLPVSLEIYKPGFEIEIVDAGNNPGRPKPTNRVTFLDPPYRDGYLAATYNAGSLTNFEGFTIPVTFRLELQRVKTRPNQLLYLQDTLTGRLTRLRSAHDASINIPEFHGMANVVDRRFPSVNHPFINYVNSEKAWLRRDDPELTNKLARLRTQARYTPTGPKRPVKILIALIIIIPAALVLYRRFERRHT